MNKSNGLVLSPEYVKTEIIGKFSPVFQHDCHEFFMYIMSTLQDEETPSASNKFQYDKENDSTIWPAFEIRHPSIIDRVFTGNHK